MIMIGIGLYYIMNKIFFFSYLILKCYSMLGNMKVNVSYREVVIWGICILENL